MGKEKRMKHTPRIFVSYAFDSKAHIMEVLEMSKCMQSHGFLVGLDDIMPSARTYSPQEIRDKHNRTLSRLKKADHVVICASSQYLATIKSNVDLPVNRHLTTKLVFNTLEAELLTQHRAGRLQAGSAVHVRPRHVTVVTLPSVDAAPADAAAPLLAGCRHARTFRWPADADDVISRLRQCGSASQQQRQQTRDVSTNHARQNVNLLEASKA